MVESLAYLLERYFVTVIQEPAYVSFITAASNFIQFLTNF